jgi:hypothetical protein
MAACGMKPFRSISVSARVVHVSSESFEILRASLAVVFIFSRRKSAVGKLITLQTSNYTVKLFPFVCLNNYHIEKSVKSTL